MTDMMDLFFYERHDGFFFIIINGIMYFFHGQHDGFFYEQWIFFLWAA